ncbi:MAG: hypothetical protein KBG02_07950 [Haliscomenobacter sp.]|nr:hypothetical protein [Haliscomenobacter sp.]MBK8656469.1 hypothetical protein [Haliscomenobacter sp.]MBP9076778.1 hypothetical protein [Haliscomenobacter sp.]MBP9873290.1 hypothetical protein [Haliscomenobacter sp.]
MNRLVVVFSLVALTLAFASCRNEPKPAAQQTPATGAETAGMEVKDDGGPKDQKAIEAFSAAIDANLSTMTLRGPQTVDFSSGQRGEVTVYADTSAMPMLAYCQIREVEQWYYLYNRRVVQFKERRPGKKGFEERRWYYSQTNLLAGELRKANTPDGLAAATPKPLSPSDAQPEETLGAVGMRVLEILFGPPPQ